MEQIESKYADDPYGDFPGEAPEGFDKLSDGIQDDGTVLSDLGWSSMHIREDLGIEGFVGVSGFEDGLQFINWVRNKLNLNLSDWEPIAITLYQCWYPADLESEENSYCYMSWRHHPSTDAIKLNPVNVYALKHVDFHLKDTLCLNAFYISRSRSLAHDVWVSKNGDAEFTPDCMNGYFHYGYHLSGKRPNTASEIAITWPSYDLPAVLAKLESFNANRYTDLYIRAEGIGFRFEDLTPSNITGLIQAYHYYGADTPFMDLATSAGIC